MVLLLIITLLSCKGGVGKTTTAVHLAAYLNAIAPTLLVDGDQNRSSVNWDKRGKLPFRVCDEREGVKLARQYEHIVIDTAAQPTAEELKSFASGCDLLIIPTTPDALSLDPTFGMGRVMQKLGASYGVLLTKVPPGSMATEAREALVGQGLRVLESEVREFTVFKHAALQGVVVDKARGKNRGIAWSCYRKLGEEICGKSI